MALTQAAIEMSFSWAMSRANAGFRDTVQGPETAVYELDLDTSAPIQAYIAKHALDPGETVTIDLQSFQTLNYETVSLVGVSAMLAIVNGSGDATCVISPGASNGLTWFWNGTNPTLTIPAGGANGYAQATATTVDATHKTLDIENAGANDEATITLVIFGRAA